MPTAISENGSSPVEHTSQLPHAGGAGELYVGRLALPLLGKRLSGPQSLDLRRAIDIANAGVLDFLLHEADLEAMAGPADERLAAALAPLRTKLDILIDMMALMSYRGVVLPPVGEVELGPNHIAWQSRQVWRRGDWLELELFFHALFREPVRLLAQVTGCSEIMPETAARVEGALAPMPAGTSERLLRLTYLTRRRQQSRQRPTAIEP